MGGAFGKVGKSKIMVSRHEEHVGRKQGDIYYVHKNPYKMGTFVNEFKCYNKTDRKMLYDVRQLKKCWSKDQINYICTEVSKLCKMSHPNLVKYHDVYEDSRNLYIVKEPISGTTLEKCLETDGKSYSEFKKAFILYQLVKVVKYCHDNDVVHKNIKPDNIIIDDHGFIKLIDFEISRNSTNDKNFFKKAGLSDYSAPEIEKEAEITKASDVWSIGILTYYLLAEWFPFGGNKIVDSFKSSANCILTFKNSTWKEYSPEATDFIKKMLLGDPSKRATAEELAGHAWFDILREGSSQSSRREIKPAIPKVSLGPSQFSTGSSGSNGSTDVEWEDWPNSTVLNALRYFKDGSYFKKVCLNLLVNQLPKEQFGDLSEDFQKLDYDKDGKLSFDDIKTGFKKAELKSSDYEIRTILANVSWEDDEYITFKEFLTATLKPTILKDDKIIFEVFKKFDVLNISSIDEEDIIRYLNKFKYKVSKEEIKEIIKTHDPENLGFLTYREFRNMINIA